MVLLTRYGPAHKIWSCSQDMVLLTRYGPAHKIWSCSQDMVLLTRYGPAHKIWSCSQDMVLLTRYGPAHKIWSCSQDFDKSDNFVFEIVNFPFLDGDVPRSTSYGVYISQLIHFARASSYMYVADFNTPNKLLTQKLLKQVYRYHKLRKTFSKFYRRYHDLISKFQVGLKSLLRQGLSEPDFYGDLVYKLKRIVGSNNFSAQFIKIISHKKIGYNINVLQQTACLVVNPIMAGNFAFLFNCTPVGLTSGSMMVPT